MIPKPVMQTKIEDILEDCIEFDIEGQAYINRSEAAKMICDIIYAEN